MKKLLCERNHRICPRCEIEQPETNFLPQRRGISRKCRRCRTVLAAFYKARRKEPGYTPKPRIENYQQHVLAKNKAWHARNIERIRLTQPARDAIHYATRTGKLVRPDTCEQCLRPGKIEAAHWDYSKRLEVRWLCRSCHARWDSADPKTKAVA